MPDKIRLPLPDGLPPGDYVLQLEDRPPETEPEQPPEPGQPPGPDTPGQTDPEPGPEPDPGPDPLGRPPAVFRELIERVPTLSLTWAKNTRYNRKHDEIIVTDGILHVEVQSREFGAGRRHRMPGEYTLLIDGEPFAPLPVKNNRWGDYLEEDIDVSAAGGGNHLVEIFSTAGEQSIPEPMYIEAGGPRREWLAIMPPSQEVIIQGHPFAIQYVRNTFEPVAEPLEPRQYTPFNYLPKGAEQWREVLIPCDESAHYPTLTDEGVPTAMSWQRYYAGSVTDDMPDFPLLDGERGICNAGAAMHIEVGSAACPELGGRVENVYVQGSYQWYKLRPNGEKVTLVGWRSNPAHMSDPGSTPVYDLVGDWSAIPEARHGFGGGWGACFIPKSLRVNTAAPRVPEEQNLHPHFSPKGDGYGPAALLTDDRFSRILKAQGGSHSHGTEWRVTEWCTDLISPFDIVPHPFLEDHYIASDQEGNAIYLLRDHGDRGEIVDTIVQGAPLAELHPISRIATSKYSLDRRRQADAVFPQGLAVVGDDLLFGMNMQEQIRKIGLRSGVIDIAVAESRTARSYAYSKFAVSTGQAGPAMTIYQQRWSNSDGGFPDVFLPGGQKYDLCKHGGPGLLRGRGGWYQSEGYGSGVGIGPGRIVWNTVRGGLSQLRLADAGEPLFDRRRFNDGESLFVQRTHAERFGRAGWGAWHGERLPWGEHPDIDYFLACSGHTQ